MSRGCHRTLHSKHSQSSPAELAKNRSRWGPGSHASSPGDRKEPVAKDTHTGQWHYYLLQGPFAYLPKRGKAQVINISTLLLTSCVISGQSLNVVSISFLVCKMKAAVSTILLTGLRDYLTQCLTLESTADSASFPSFGYCYYTGTRQITCSFVLTFWLMFT